MHKATRAEPPLNANEGPADPPPARQSKPPPDPRAATIKAPANRLARQSPNDNHARAAMPVSHPHSRCLHIQIAALQIDRTVPFVGAFQTVNDLAAAGQDISAGALPRLDRRLLVDAQDQRVCRWVQVEADDIGGPLFGPGAGLVANCGSVLTHHERRRRHWTPSRRSSRPTASSEAPNAAASKAPSHLAN